MKFIQLVFKHSRTGLPGFYFKAVNIIIEFLGLVRANGCCPPHILLNNLDESLGLILINRKPTLYDSDSTLASAHILSFPSAEQMANEKGLIAAKKVHKHYFYFGNHGDVSFDLSLESGIVYQPGQVNFLDNSIVSVRVRAVETLIFNSENSKVQLYRNGREFEQSCHFSPVYDDFFLTYSLWNIWYLGKLNRRYSIANLYQDYLENKNNYSVSSNQNFPNSFSFELLSFWSIAYSSHANGQGINLGLPILDQFMKNIQVFKKGRYSNGFEDYEVPSSLDEFLKNVTVPYLIRGLGNSSTVLEAADSDFININEARISKGIRDETFVSPPAPSNEAIKIGELIAEMAPFISIGTCYRPKNNVGWDVLFDMKYGTVPSTGYIECKLWSKPVGLPLMFPYYKKACLNGFKLSILVTSKIQVSLVSEKASKFKRTMLMNSTETDNATKTETETEIETETETEIDNAIQKAAEQAKEELVQNKYEKMINNLWIDPKQRINIYTISFRNQIDENQQKQVGSFKFGILKEFENPTGVFIILESSFNPPKRTSSS